VEFVDRNNPHPPDTQTRCPATQQEVQATVPNATVKVPRLATTASSSMTFWMISARERE
jgi:hypothetical protein